MTVPSFPEIVLSGSGMWIPANIITNRELVDSYNAFAEDFNCRHAGEIQAGILPAREPSSTRFIERASGIKSRYVYEKDGILDIGRMRPKIPERPGHEISHQAEMAVFAARRAMEAAQKTAADIDAVIVSCTYTQRAYPAIAVEVQHALGIHGFGFDMLAACSAATFGLKQAHDILRAGSAGCVLVVNPELMTPQIDFRDRNSHFIFGDAGTAVILETGATAVPSKGFTVLSAGAQTRFSNNIRSNYGFLARASDADPYGPDKLFHQHGRRVFEEVTPVVTGHIIEHLATLGLNPGDIKRFWLHQANINMNKKLVRELLNENAPDEAAPLILGCYANTVSAGVIITFHLHHRDMAAGNLGLLCSFGAGYSVGSLVLQKR